jgi:hypothetical protein
MRAEGTLWRQSYEAEDRRDPKVWPDYEAA